MTKEEAIKIVKDIRQNSLGKRYKNEKYEGLKFRLIEANAEKTIADRWEFQIKFSVGKRCFRISWPRAKV